MIVQWVSKEFEVIAELRGETAGGSDGAGEVGRQIDGEWHCKSEETVVNNGRKKEDETRTARPQRTMHVRNPIHNDQMHLYRGPVENDTMPGGGGNNDLDGGSAVRTDYLIRALLLYTTTGITAAATTANSLYSYGWHLALGTR